MLLSGWRHPQRKLIDSLAVIAGVIQGAEKVRGSKWKERKNKMIRKGKNCVESYLTIGPESEGFGRSEVFSDSIVESTNSINKT